MSNPEQAKSDHSDYPEYTGDPGPQALATGRLPKMITGQDREEAIEAGTAFAKTISQDDRSTPCLVITGEFVPPGYPIPTADGRVLERCKRLFRYRTEQADSAEAHKINVLVDSPGGSLDSAFKIVRYLTWYANKVDIYVPRQAKSASTLLALGANCIYMSPFAELGPLDTKAPDPRNPESFVSALDCYQSVDYVCKFGVNTMGQALVRLGNEAGRATALSEVLHAASKFGVGAIQPMLDRIIALDFGAWGRSLEIAERYARQILEDNASLHESEDPSLTIGKSGTNGAMDRAARIAHRLVFEYPHHLYFMDYREVREIGLKARIMDKEAYEAAMKVVGIVDGKSFIEFVNEDDMKQQPPVEETRTAAAR